MDRVDTPEHDGHPHTANPFLNDPWCAICDALLTKAIVYEDWLREELEKIDADPRKNEERD